jgi:hypothetical protein
VVVDLLRFTTPGLAGILELADEFLLLGVDADARIAAAAKLVTLLLNVAELPIAFCVGLSRVQRLSVAAQPELLLAQQSADGGRTGAAIEFLRQRSQTRTAPFLAGTGIAGGFGSDAFQQIDDERRIFFSMRGRPPPGSRIRSEGRP